ncbi:hypothetical protein P8452_65243 [Trifolium repens]|nr:hypothetical protein P8452_65243 [Trifolium repens]
MRGVSRVWLFRCEVVNGVEDGGDVGVFGYSGGFVTVKVREFWPWFSCLVTPEKARTLGVAEGCSSLLRLAGLCGASNHVTHQNEKLQNLSESNGQADREGTSKRET